MLVGAATENKQPQFTTHADPSSQYRLHPILFSSRLHCLPAGQFTRTERHHKSVTMLPM